MPTTLAIRELHQAARAITQRLLAPPAHIPITAQTAYLTCRDFQVLLRLHNIRIAQTTLRHWLSPVHQSRVQFLLADTAPTPWCHTVTNQQARNGLVYIIPLAYLSDSSQHVARTHNLARSFTDRLHPRAKLILTLLIKDRQLTYATAVTHCHDPLPRRTFFDIKRMLLTQERHFPWTPSSSL